MSLANSARILSQLPIKRPPGCRPPALTAAAPRSAHPAYPSPPARPSASDRIRERLACDGIAAVIPPISTRCKKLPYDKELYRSRNRVERFFNKLKQFRRLAPVTTNWPRLS